MAIFKKINLKFIFNLIDFNDVFKSYNMPTINDKTIPNVKLYSHSNKFNVKLQKIVVFNDVSD